MSRSKFMRWMDRLRRAEDIPTYWYHMTRIKYYNKPEKLKILDDWIRSTNRPGMD